MTYIFMILMLSINMMKVVDLFGKGVFNLALSDVFLLPVLFYMFLQIKNKRFNEIFKHYIVMILLMAWIVISGVHAMLVPDINDGGFAGLLSEFIKTAICVGYFFVGYYFLKKCSIRQFTFMWVIALLISVFWGLLSFNFIRQGIPFLGIQPRYSYYFLGTDTDPNHVSTFYFFSFFAFGALLDIYNTRFQKNMLYLAMLSAVLGVFFTGSRGGIISFILGLGAVLFCLSIKNRRKALLLVLLLIFAFNVTIIVDHITMDDYIMTRVISKFSNFQTGMDVRSSLGKVALNMGNDHLLFGVGRGNYHLNSEPYFEKLSYKYIEDIPHNTYTGLYAEVGVIGLLLFFSPVLIIMALIIKLLKRDSNLFWNNFESFAWIAGAFSSLAVQASVLNIENRRFFWFVAGFLVYVLTNVDLDKATLVTKRVGKKANKGLVLLLVLLIICFSYFNVKTASVPYFITTHSEKSLFFVPYIFDTLNETFYLRYQLIVPMNSEMTPRVKVTVIEEGAQGEFIPLSEKFIRGSNGVIEQEFKPLNKGAKIFLLVESIDETLPSFRLLPQSMVFSDQILILNRRFYLQPQPLKKYFSKSMLYAHEVTPTYFDNAIGAVFADKLVLENVRLSDDLSKLVLSYRVLEGFEEWESYTTYLYGYPEVLNYIEEGLWWRGFEVYSAEAPIATSSWKSGDVHEIVFNLHSNEGIFEFRTGFALRKGDQTYTLQLEDNLNFLTLGVFNFIEKE